MTTNTQFEQEMLDRTRRLESRVVQLGDHVGANLRSKLRIDVRDEAGQTTVHVDALDVSLSRIMAELKAKAPGKYAPVPVYLHGELVAMVYV